MLRQNSNTTRPNIGARFALGQTFITPGAQEALEIAGQTAIQFLRVTCPAIGESFPKMTFARTSFHLKKVSDC